MTSAVPAESATFAPPADPSQTPGASTGKPPRLHLIFLDGLRGFAAMWVLLNHVIDTPVQVLGPGVKSNFARGMLSILNGGHWAVDIFIVLSGFCLMIPIARRGRLEGGSARFFRKRCHRILPPYFACMLIMLGYGFCVHHLGKHAEPSVSSKAVLVNALLFEDWVPGTNSINGVFWSVAVEWKIYFLLPCFVLLWRRSQSLMMLAATMIGLCLIPALHWAFPQNNLSRACPWYVILFAMGLLAAGLVFGKRPALRRVRIDLLMGILAVFFAMAALGFYHCFPPSHGLNNEGAGVDWRLPAMDILTGAAIAAAIGLLASWALNGTRNQFLSFFELSPLVWIGTMGYSLYLLHPLALDILGAAANRLVVEPRLRAMAVLWAGVPLSLGAAYAFYLMVERRFLNPKGPQQVLG